jgi:hypothetical protein
MIARMTIICGKSVSYTFEFRKKYIARPAFSLPGSHLRTASFCSSFPYRSAFYGSGFYIAAAGFLYKKGFSLPSF